MRIVPMRLFIGASIAAASTFGIVSFASSAGAVSSTTCSAVSGKVHAHTVQLEGCTAATTGGSGSISGSHGKDTVVWANGGTTVFKPRSGAVKVNECPAGDSEIHLKGTVASSTGAAAGVQGAVSADICIPVSGKGKVSLLKGTVWRF
jgi:Ca2+-binding RTX toxin-like protein